MGRDLRILWLAPVLALAGCHGIGDALTNATVGTGPEKTETRTVGEFTKIRITSAIQADVKIGDKASVIVDAKESLLPLVQTHLDGDTLVVETKESIDSSTPIKVHIVTKALDGVDASGAASIDSGEVKTTNFDAEASGASTVILRGDLGKFKLDSSGASRVTLVGKAQSAVLGAEGASEVDATKFELSDVKAKASGASNLKLGKSQTIDLEASGASTINYEGTPTIKRKDASGASSINGG